MATDNSAGELAILKHDVTIVNQSGGTVVINQTTANRVFDVSSAVLPAAINVTITGVTIQGGNTGGTGGGILVNSSSTLTLNNDVIQNNFTAADGGGIAVVGGSLTLNNDLVTGNSATNGPGGIEAINCSVTLSAVRLENNTGALGGGVGFSGNGSVTITGTEVSANNALTGSGGGIFVAGGTNAADSLTITNSLIEDNSARNDTPGQGGGGLFFASVGTVTITGTEFSANNAFDGGGILDTTNAQLTISSCTFDANVALDNGGGLNLQTTQASSLANVTLSGNQAGSFGGGLCFTAASGAVTLQDDTIAFNEAQMRGGGVSSSSGQGSVTFESTIVAKNEAAASNPDVDNNGVASDMKDGGDNFIGDNTGASNTFTAGPPNAHGSFVGTHAAPLDPLLKPLADNGGSALLPDGSHLLTHQDDANQVNNGVRDRAPLGLPSDERGFPTAGAARDIGAFEFQNFDLGVNVSGPPGPARAGRPLTFTVTVRNLGLNTSHGVTLNDTVPAGTTILGASGSPKLVAANVLLFAVPDLPAGGSASFTVTVLPNAAGPFTDAAEASAHDDPNTANNAASVTVTVLPGPFPASGFADVTGLVQLMPLGRRRRPQRQLAFRITNVSTTPIQGPLAVVVPGLRPRRGPKLLNAAGKTPGGQKFVRVNIGADGILDPGQSAVVLLIFSQPFTPPGLDVLAGTFA